MARALALAALLFASCTLDPRSVLEKAALKVRVSGLVDGGAVLTLTVRDAAGKQLVKRAAVAGKTEVEVVFEAGTVVAGPVDLGAVLEDAAEADLACGAARGEAGAAEPVPLALVAADDAANCGACGRACEGAPHATRACASRACGPLSCEPGWFDVNGAEADGCESQCAAPQPEASVAACSDGADNDCDGLFDCADPGCGARFARPCAFGACAGEEVWSCAGNSWGACGATAGLESTPAACTDGADNDCDGKADCLDEECNGIAQSCSVQACAGEQLFLCAQASFEACRIDVTLEATVAMCGDGLDNDCDGQTDCAEAVCQDERLEATIAACSDGLDNDCDGKSDCQDPGCLDIRQPCTGTDLCAAGVKLWLCSVRLFGVCLPYAGVPENTGLLCGDGLDNDCDQKRDCADADCAGKGCALGKVCCPDGTCAKRCG